MNLDRRPVNEERACGAALGGSGCRSPLAVNPARPGCSAPAALPGPERPGKQTPPLFLAPARKRAGLARLGLARPPLLALSATLLRSPSSAADVAQPPPRSHELCRLRPLTANICCGCLLQAAWKQFWGERRSLAVQTIALY